MDSCSFYVFRATLSTFSVILCQLRLMIRCRFLWCKQLGIEVGNCLLEQETDVDVECAVSILLVEAACILECHDEVLIHDETQTSTC